MRCTGAPQTGHGWPIAAVHRHLGAEGGDLLGEAVAAPRARRRSVHSRERRARRREQPRDLVASSSLLRQRDRREPRAVQDLVGVGVADAAEEARIGERALERVVLAAQRARANAASVGRQHLEAAGVERGQRRRARDAGGARRAASCRPR